MTNNASPAKELGLYIPPYVRQCPGLISAEWLVLAQVIQLSGGERGCFASQQWLADSLAFTRRSITRIMDRLERRGLLRRIGRRLLAPCETEPVWRGAPHSPERNKAKAKRSKAEKQMAAADETPLSESDKMSLPNETNCPPKSDKMSHSNETNCPSESDKMSLPTVTNCPPESDKMSYPSDKEVNTELKKELNPLREASLAPPGFFDDSSSKKSRAVSPLESKLVEICGLKPLLGKKAFPGALFGKTLAVLRELEAEPAELARFVAWWREDAMSFRRTFPQLQQVARHFHESRPAAPEPEPAAVPAPQPADANPPAAPPDTEEEPETEEQRDARWRQRDPRFVELIIRGQYDEACEAGDEAEIAKVEARWRRWFPEKTLPPRDPA